MCTPLSLKDFLRRSGLRQADFCRATGVTPTKLSDFLHGRASLSPANLQRIASVYPEGWQSERKVG